MIDGRRKSGDVGPTAEIGSGEGVKVAVGCGVKVGVGGTGVNVAVGSGVNVGVDGIGVSVAVGSGVSVGGTGVLDGSGWGVSCVGVEVGVSVDC